MRPESVLDNDMIEVKYKDKLIALGLNVAYYRKYRLMTQAELAEKASVSVSTIQKLENANLYTRVSLETICKIADALGVSESDLLDFKKLKE